MVMTVRRLAQRVDLGLTLVAGRDNDDRAIAWAHAIELADPTPYLSGGELVMTTGMNVGTTSTGQFDYLARLAAAGVAALAFDTGTTFTHVPNGIIAAGDDLAVPVLAVPARKLQQHYLSILRAGAARMLQALMNVYPGGLTKDEISARAGIAATSGTFTTYLGQLRRNGLIVQRGSEMVATDILMQGARADIQATKVP